MIDSLKDATAKSVRQDIDAHRTVWSNRSGEDRRKAVSDAESRATPDEGHRATCPACGSMALVQGTEFGPVDTRLGEDEIIEKQEMYPSSFECFACGLRCIWSVKAFGLRIRQHFQQDCSLHGRRILFGLLGRLCSRILRSRYERIMKCLACDVATCYTEQWTVHGRVWSARALEATNPRHLRHGDRVRRPLQRPESVFTTFSGSRYYRLS